MSALFPNHFFLAMIKRDLLLAFRRRSDLMNPLLFFVLVTSLFPLGISPESSILRTLAPGILWVTVLLATLLSLDNLFRGDMEDHSLEQLILSPASMHGIILAKVLVHWLITGVPLILLTPLLAMMFALSWDAVLILMLTLMLGTPTMSLIGAIGAALTAGLRKGGALLSLLILPLYIPVLIFGAGAVDAAASGLSIAGQLYFLAALLVLALTLAPFAIKSALQISVNS